MTVYEYTLKTNKTRYCGFHGALGAWIDLPAKQEDKTMSKMEAL